MMAGIRLVYIRIPKTASTSIAKALQSRIQVTARHLPWWEFSSISNKYVISSIRHPLDRLVSAYLYLVNHKQGNPDVAKILDCKDFAELCDNLDKLIGYHYFLMEQHKWIYDGDIKMYDYLIRYENLVDDFAGLQRILGIKAQLNKYRVGTHQPWFKYYNKDRAKKVIDILRADFDIFGYDIDKTLALVDN